MGVMPARPGWGRGAVNTRPHQPGPSSHFDGWTTRQGRRSGPVWGGGHCGDRSPVSGGSAPRAGGAIWLHFRAWKTDSHCWRSSAHGCSQDNRGDTAAQDQPFGRRDGAPGRGRPAVHARYPRLSPLAALPSLGPEEGGRPSAAVGEGSGRSQGAPLAREAARGRQADRPRGQTGTFSAAPRPALREPCCLTRAGVPCGAWLGGAAGRALPTGSLSSTLSGRLAPRPPRSQRARQSSRRSPWCSGRPGSA